MTKSSTYIKKKKKYDCTYNIIYFTEILYQVKCFCFSIAPKITKALS